MKTKSLFIRKSFTLNYPTRFRKYRRRCEESCTIFNVQDKANKYAEQLQAKIDAVKKANPETQGEKKKALIMVAYNDETFGAYKSALQESLLNQLGYTNVATGTSGLTLENLVSMDPELIIYVTSDRNQKLDEKAVDLMKANAVLENVPAIKNQKIMTISYDELMDYGPGSDWFPWEDQWLYQEIRSLTGKGFKLESVFLQTMILNKPTQWFF